MLESGSNCYANKIIYVCTSYVFISIDYQLYQFPFYSRLFRFPFTYLQFLISHLLDLYSLTNLVYFQYQIYLRISPFLLKSNISISYSYYIYFHFTTLVYIFFYSTWFSHFHMNSIYLQL